MMMMYMGSQNQNPEGIRAGDNDHDLLFMNPIGNGNGNGIQGLSLSLSTQMHHQPSYMNYPNPSSSSLAGNHSKYLKAAQQLLDEAVNVRKVHKQQYNANPKQEGRQKHDEIKDQDSRNELSQADKHELQDKLSKLLPMLEEVDKKYKQYHNQMQMVASSFDAIAGTGATMPYTTLAVQTISRHFRCLRDSIERQIKLTRKSLGEEDGSDINSKGIGISRLRFVDQQIRQQKALQQMGLMQPNSWRPERGLPENSVSFLRAWLFEHFLHPYPKDSDKSMLARQTGLTRSQVSNWFINARVRLWKPMVEEMYKEEFGEAEMESSSASEELQHKPDNFHDVEEMVGLHLPAQSEEVHFGMMMMGSSSSSSDPYQITEMGRYGKTLSLGFHHCEDGRLHHHHGYVHLHNQHNVDHDSSMVVEVETTDQFNCLDSSSNRQQRIGLPFFT
ncbi:BEL1-like homeodomain protein 7 isoform X2 [Impatiens glandulifera]|nr:BEL1-like homeodomain protein 7 isoform X2 [Impatiens glandulifera]